MMFSIKDIEFDTRPDSEYKVEDSKNFITLLNNKTLKEYKLFFETKEFYKKRNLRFYEESKKEFKDHVIQTGLLELNNTIKIYKEKQKKILDEPLSILDLNEVKNELIVNYNYYVQDNNIRPDIYNSNFTLMIERINRSIKKIFDNEEYDFYSKNIKFKSSSQLSDYIIVNKHFTLRYILEKFDLHNWNFSENEKDRILYIPYLYRLVYIYDYPVLVPRPAKYFYEIDYDTDVVITFEDLYNAKNLQLKEINKGGSCNNFKFEHEENVYYRFDSRPPKVIFNEGFKKRPNKNNSDEETDFYEKFMAHFHGGKGRFVALTTGNKIQSFLNEKEFEIESGSFLYKITDIKPTRSFDIYINWIRKYLHQMKLEKKNQKKKITFKEAFNSHKDASLHSFNTIVLEGEYIIDEVPNQNIELAYCFVKQYYNLYQVTGKLVNSFYKYQNLKEPDYTDLFKYSKNEVIEIINQINSLQIEAGAYSKEPEFLRKYQLVQNKDFPEIIDKLFKNKTFGKQTNETPIEIKFQDQIQLQIDTNFLTDDISKNQIYLKLKIGLDPLFPFNIKFDIGNPMLCIRDKNKKFLPEIDAYNFCDPTITKLIDAYYKFCESGKDKFLIQNFLLKVENEMRTNNILLKVFNDKMYRKQILETPNLDYNTELNIFISSIPKFNQIISGLTFYPLVPDEKVKINYMIDYLEDGIRIRESYLPDLDEYNEGVKQGDEKKVKKDFKFQ